MEHGIQAASCDQGHPLGTSMQSQLQHCVGGIAHELERAAGKPVADQTDHLMCPHPDSLVSLA
ncbi:hypothetical protein [Tengunoibacter tsumagoiensis]|uniref:hypothetical protein n=1 Tax=Tengunoibacter tsumagoiensis TaxID=2014871 RepID=UPI001FECC5F8|nr:hypothetical protein [Tengunoibacter tsumagoiensis]